MRTNHEQQNALDRNAYMMGRDDARAGFPCSPRGFLHPDQMGAYRAGWQDFHKMQAFPAMLAALQELMSYVGGWDAPADHPCGKARDAIALATAAPTGEQAPPVDADGKRTDTWNLVPGAQPEDPTCDDLDKRTYTALCQQLDGQGTIWVSEVEGNTIDTAIQAAREACAFDWELYR